MCCNWMCNTEIHGHKGLQKQHHGAYVFATSILESYATAGDGLIPEMIHGVK